MKWMVRTTDFKQELFSTQAKTCSKNELLLSAAKKLGLFWLIAVLCVLIPVLHFFLVPTFFIIGIVAFITQMKKTHFVADATYNCPNCHQTTTVQKFFFNEGLRFRCKNCQQQLVLFEEPS